MYASYRSRRRAVEAVIPSRAVTFSVLDAPGDPEAVHLLDDEASSLVALCPTRGGLVTQFRVGAREVLYLDRATLVDRAKNVRGGVPVLFPIAGRLAGDAYRVGAETFSLAQHGFARNLPWRVLARSTDGAARVTLGLDSSPATLAAFPWAFRARFTIELRGATLSLAQEYANDGDSPMPLHMGLHPYFFVPDADKAGTRVETDATRAFDNTTKRTGAVGPIDLTLPEVDLHLVDHRAPTARLRTPDGRAVRLDLDPSYGPLVLWTLAGRDFVCLEPWSALADALNTGVGVISVGPGAAHRARFAITAE
jgi:galactose mutarotase-like enzyme